MSRKAARRLLVGAALLLVPLPYLVAAEGAVPVVRFALLGLVAAAYAAFVDGSGVAWPIAGLLLGHAVLYGLGLWGAAALAAALLPRRLRGPLVVAGSVAGLAAAFAFEIYHTPFGADSAWSTWRGLLP